MTNCQPVMLAVALPFLLVGCGGTEVPQQQQPVVQQPVVQQPVAQQPDPVAAAKRVAESFPVGVYFQPAEHNKKEGALVRDYWSKIVYVVEEPARFDVKKTDSLVSPIEAIIEVTYRRDYGRGGDLSKQDLYGPDVTGMSDGWKFSTKDKAEAAMDIGLGGVEIGQRFRFSWQDGKWKIRDEPETRYGREGEWTKGPTPGTPSAKKALSEMKRWGVYKP